MEKMEDITKKEFCTLDELFVFLPVLEELGWSKRFMVEAMESDMIIGFYDNNSIAQFAVESVQSLIHYYNQYVDSDQGKTFYSLEELYGFFPTLNQRRWSKSFIIDLIENGLIHGQKKDKKKFNISIKSFKSLLKYHNEYLKSRIKIVGEDLNKSRMKG